MHILLLHTPNQTVRSFTFFFVARDPLLPDILGFFLKKTRQQPPTSILELGLEHPELLLASLAPAEPQGCAVLDEGGMLGIIAHLLQTFNFGVSGAGVVSPLSSGADGTSALPEPDVSWSCWYGCVSLPFILFLV